MIQVKKQFVRQNEALESHEYLQYQQGWSPIIGDENFETPYYLNHSMYCWLSQVVYSGI